MTKSKKILIIGGTGIIGRATIKEALSQNYLVTTISLKKDKSIPHTVTQLVVDRAKLAQSKFASEYIKAQKWNIVFDIFSFNARDAKQTYKLFKHNTEHIFVLSTTLVYDRSKPSSTPIKSSHPLSKKGLLGGYVDHKLELEKFWNTINDTPWTILRPYHIVGETSLLGCIPFHNRDPLLLQKIKKGQPLSLCEGGNINFNIIHPQDIAKIVLKAAGRKNTFFKHYNAINPQPIKAKDYFKFIGQVLGKKVNIKSIPIKEVWEAKGGWELTTLPHIYDMSDLKKDIGYIPSTSVKNAIQDAINTYPKFNNKPIPVHERMTLRPRPKPIKWLLSTG